MKQAFYFLFNSLCYVLGCFLLYHCIVLNFLISKGEDFTHKIYFGLPDPIELEFTIRKGTPDA